MVSTCLCVEYLNTVASPVHYSYASFSAKKKKGFMTDASRSEIEDIQYSNFEFDKSFELLES